MLRIAPTLLAALLLAPLAATSRPATDSAATLSLERIMSEPDWIGPSVESPRWSVDGSAIFYELKRDGTDIRDLYRVDPASGKSVRVEDSQLAQTNGTPMFNRQHTHAAWLRHGDVFIQRLSNGTLTQVTRSNGSESKLQWMADGTGVQYRANGSWYAFRLDGDGAHPVAELKTGENPQTEDRNGLERYQLYLFDTLRDIESDKDAAETRDEALSKADASRAREAFWLGKDVEIAGTSLSPSGDWMLVVTQPAGYDEGKKPDVNHYVSASGYSETKTTRNYVGRNAPAPQSLLLLDLATHKQYTMSLDALPGIHEDPLAELRAAAQERLRKAGHEDEAKALEAPETRGVRIADYGMATIEWSDDGSRVAVQLRAIDNKDRWIASVNLDQQALVPQHRLHDDAWINWLFNGFGFVPGSHQLWYLSEESGYSHLYLKPLGGPARQLTQGDFEVRQVVASGNGDWLYFVANHEAPYRYELYRVPADGGAIQRLTEIGGVGGYSLSPDNSAVLVQYSGSYLRPQIAVVSADGSNARKLTDTRSETYKAMDWIQPQVVEVPSTHGAGKIYAKLYKAPDFDPSQAHPAVLFVHGAGYLQDVDTGWSHYFREQMFNNLLAREGYVVLAMDYRASEGYGRDWRTAIYRNMGHPELEDLLDGKSWLVKNHHVDPDRVGIYGGSYGGFMTFMALLRAPGEFAAGAAVRPVADWRAYNHEYTSNILNTPQLDPEAYRVSSPIEFAAGLEDPLLICHGLVDDNVLPDDSIRLYQRFIELHKEDFWLSLYPMEPHGFVHADSWYDEYRRIHDLFSRFVLPANQPAN